MADNLDTTIGTNVRLKGSLKNQGSILIHGTVDGEVVSEENVTVGDTATVKGPVTATNVLVSGIVRGSITAKEKLEVEPKGQIFGDITAKILIIKPGAVFVGRSLMPEELALSKGKGKGKIEPEIEDGEKTGE